MAKYWTNKGRYALAKGTFDAATKNIAAYKGTAPIASVVADLNVLSEMVSVASMTELTGATYARVVMACTIAEDDTNDRVTLTYSGTPSLGSGIPVGETITVVVYYNTSGIDSTRELYWVDVLGTPLPTNGSGMTYTPQVDTFA
jgi:hypothetical protein